MLYPWLTLSILFAAGAAVAPPAIFALVGVALAALLFARRPTLGLPALAVAAGLLVGGADARWAAAAPAMPPTPFIGQITDVQLRGQRLAVLVAPDGAPAWRARVWLDRRPAGLAPGAQVRVEGRLRRLDPADNPGGFDAAAHGARDRVRWQVRGTVRLLTPASTLHRLPTQAREGARAHLTALQHPFGAGVLAGLLLGDRSAVPPEAAAALQATGAAHLMAVSGLHVGGLAALVFALIAAVARRFEAVRPHRWAALVALPAALLFVALAQFPLSACRAGLMVGGWLLGHLLGRRPQGLELLGVAALAVFALRPGALHDVGFQLSFGAVAALLLLPKHHSRLVGAVAVTLLAAAATAPLQAWHFGTAAPLSPVANLVLTPLAALVVVPLGLLGLVLAPLWSGPLALAAMLAELLVALAEGLADLGGGLQIVGAYTAPAFAAPIVVWLGWRLARLRPALLIATAGLVATVLMRPTGVTIDFIAVGQGDAVLLRSPAGAVLVDAGPDPRARALIGYLRHEGVRRLEHVLISHRHPDHYLGVLGLLDALPIGAVWDHGLPDGVAPWRRLVRRLHTRQIPVGPPSEPLQVGALHLQIVTPAPDPALAENDRSLVARVRGPAGAVLLTGDVEGPGEARLLAAGFEPVEVLKAPHHGSKTSSSPGLIAAACPQAAVFNVGRHNRYGFPHAPVRARYAAAHIPTWRTDLDGRIRVRLEQKPVTIEALRRPSRALKPVVCEARKGP